MKSRRSFIAAGIVCTFFCSVVQVYAALPWLHVDGNEIKDSNGDVVVLRGVDLIDLGSQQSWYGGAINMIDRLTNKSDPCGSSPGWYTKVIRIAIYPMDSGLNSPWFCETDFNNYYNNLLRPVVNRCAQRGVYAIIDWHYVSHTYDHNATTTAFWTYMAPKFANDSHVLFELFQEPNDTGISDTAKWLSVRSYMQNWVNIVRTYAPNNLILVGTPDYCRILTPTVNYPVSGTNIVYVSHLYPNYWTTSYKNQVKNCHAHYPVFSSEWGFSETSGSSSTNTGTITNYGQPLMDFLEGLKISHSTWVANCDWTPSMFWDPISYSQPIWPLRIGEGEMGGFAKDTLYARRNDNQPGLGFLDFIDFADFAAWWRRTNCGPSNTWCADADVNHNGSVELSDLQQFVAYWLGGD